MSAWHGVGRRRREVHVNERICSIRIVDVFIIVEFFYLFGVWYLVSCNDILVMFLSTRLVLLLLLLLLRRGVLSWMNKIATMKSLGVI